MAAVTSCACRPRTFARSGRRPARSMGAMQVELPAEDEEPEMIAGESVHTPPL